MNRKRNSRSKSRRVRRRWGEQEILSPSSTGTRAEPTGAGPFYGAGPVHGLPAAAGPTADMQPGPGQPESASAADDRQPLPGAQQFSLPTLSISASREDQRQVVEGRSVRLRGRTDSGQFNFEAHTENVQATRAAGCSGCAAAECLRVTGSVVATYSVSPTVTLPSVADYPDLTPCQRRRVQDAIDNVLAPHEQLHVDAFRTYNGTTRRPFELTICRSAWNQGAVDGLVRPEQAARQAAAQAASDALDPFNFDVDLDCQEPREASPPGRTSADNAEPAPDLAASTSHTEHTESS